MYSATRFDCATSVKDLPDLIAGCPQGRSVYYRLARPELSSLLKAAEYVLAATGHDVQVFRS
jgi:hypothetical protein